MTGTNKEVQRRVERRRENLSGQRRRRPRQMQSMSGIRKYQVLRYLFFGLILVYVGFVFLFAGGSTKSFDEVAESIEIAIEADHLARLDARELKRLYGLNSADYDGTMVCVSTSGMSAEEVLLIKVKYSDQMSEVEEAVQAYLENRQRDFEEYALEQARLVADRVYCIRGDYLFVAVSEHAEQYRSVFLKSL